MKSCCFLQQIRISCTLLGPGICDMDVWMPWKNSTVHFQVSCFTMVQSPTKRWTLEHRHKPEDDDRWWTPNGSLAGKKKKKEPLTFNNSIKEKRRTYYWRCRSPDITFSTQAQRVSSITGWLIGMSQSGSRTSWGVSLSLVYCLSLAVHTGEGCSTWVLRLNQLFRSSRRSNNMVTSMLALPCRNTGSGLLLSCPSMTVWLAGLSLCFCLLLLQHPLHLYLKFQIFLICLHFQLLH